MMLLIEELWYDGTNMISNESRFPEYQELISNTDGPLCR